MKKFVLFLCLLILWSCTHARPDLSLGYRYNQGHSSAAGAFLQAPGSFVKSYAPTASANSYFASQPSLGQIGSSGFSSSTPSKKQLSFGGFGQHTTNFGSGFGASIGGFGGGIGGSSFSSGFGGSSQIGSDSIFQSQEGLQPTFAAPIVSKHFYIHAAPADDDEEEVVRHIQVGQPQKHYRVVFINTPSSHSTKAKIIADIAPTEEKTAIYVLARKNNALDISAEVNTPAPVNNKPEVFFVKYKTPEEAIHAQHSIQAQYDALGGTSDISNEGQIPVSSVVGTTSAAADISSSASTSDNSLTSVEIPHTGTNSQQTYLPSNTKYSY